MKVLITGGAGFIGRHTTRGLLAENVRVLVIDDFSSSARENVDEFLGFANFDLIEGDVCEQRQLREVMVSQKPDVVVHLAGLVSVARCQQCPDDSFRLNVHATKLVVTEAELAGCKRFVFASSAAVYGNLSTKKLSEVESLPTALSPYGEHKAEAEKWLMATKTNRMARIALRYFNVYGIGQPADSPYAGVITRFLEDSIYYKKPLQVFGDGEQSRDFIHVDDVVRANLEAIAGALPGGAYNVCTGSGTSINQVIAQLRSRFPDYPVQHRPTRRGEIRHSLGDPSRLACALGEWTPIAFNKGFAKLLDTVASTDPSSIGATG
jgi:UDP-glucose 4-epimerase